MILRVSAGNKNRGLFVEPAPILIYSVMKSYKTRKFYNQSANNIEYSRAFIPVTSNDH